MDLEGGTNSADGCCRMRRASAVRRRRASKAMTLEELEDWIDRLDPPPLVDGVSMLDGYMAAIIVGPCSISPYEWMEHMLGAHGDHGGCSALQCRQRGVGNGTGALRADLRAHR